MVSAPEVEFKNIFNMYIDVTIEEVQYIHYGIRMASECGPRCGGQPSQQPAAVLGSA